VRREGEKVVIFPILLSMLHHSSMLLSGKSTTIGRYNSSSNSGRKCKILSNSSASTSSSLLPFSSLIPLLHHLSRPPMVVSYPPCTVIWAAREVGVRREGEKVEEHATCVLPGRGRKVAATATQARPRTIVRMVIKEGQSRWFRNSNHHCNLSRSPSNYLITTRNSQLQCIHRRKRNQRCHEA